MDDIIAFKEHFAPFDSPMSAGETADRWWQRVSSRKPKMALAKLARMVLSVVPHAAEPEKSFSFMGLVHDPLRNRFRLSLWARWFSSGHTCWVSHQKKSKHLTTWKLCIYTSAAANLFHPVEQHWRTARGSSYTWKNIGKIFTESMLLFAACIALCMHSGLSFNSSDCCCQCRGFKTKVKQPQQKKKRTVDAADSGPVDITTTKANMTYNPLPPHSGQVEAQNESEPQDPEPQEVDEWVQFLTQVYENDKGDAEI